MATNSHPSSPRLDNPFLKGSCSTLWLSGLAILAMSILSSTRYSHFARACGCSADTAAGLGRAMTPATSARANTKSHTLRITDLRGRTTPLRTGGTTVGFEGPDPNHAPPSAAAPG